MADDVDPYSTAIDDVVAAFWPNTETLETSVTCSGRFPAQPAPSLRAGRRCRPGWWGVAGYVDDTGAGGNGEHEGRHEGGEPVLLGRQHVGPPAGCYSALAEPITSMIPLRRLVKAMSLSIELDDRRVNAPSIRSR
jgi:hypothetical protein